MLFKPHSDFATGEKDFFEFNPGARAMEEFNACTSRQMFFVCLVADRDEDSPLRTLPERKRREKAVMIAGYPMEGTRPDKNGRNLINGKVESVERAIRAYKEIQYDENRAMLDAINAQIQETFDAIALDKREACRVVKIKTDKKSGNTEKTEYVDTKLLGIMRKDAINLAANLPKLKEAKRKLLAEIKAEEKSSEPIEDVMTYTPQDVPEDYGEEGGSTLDMINAKRFNKQ